MKRKLFYLIFAMSLNFFTTALKAEEVSVIASKMGYKPQNGAKESNPGKGSSDRSNASLGQKDSAGIAEDVSFRFDKESMGLNETLTIELIAHKKINENPDFSPLEKEFTILSTSVGFATKIINGKMTEEAKWTVKLMPKRVGELSIPPLKIGPYYTGSQKIEVKAEALQKKEDSIFIETEIEGQEGNFFVEMPLIYTLRLFCREQIVQGSLSELVVSDKDAIVSVFDKEKQYEGYHSNGKRYLVVERKYAVIPQHEGELIFEPLIFEGVIAKGQDHFFHFQSDYKRIFSDEKKVLIKKAPVTFTNNPWFVAKEFTIEGEWSEELSSLKVSEPLTWTIILKAKGNFASQIPDITLNFEKGLKHYVDKAEVSDEIVDHEVTGRKEIKVAIIPSKEGEYVSPAIKIEWWNLKTNRKEETIFSKKKLFVKKGNLEEGEVAFIQPQNQEMQELIAEPVREVNEAGGEEEGFFQISSFWILFSIFLGAFSLFLLILLKREKRNKSELVSTKNSFLKKGVLNKSYIKNLRSELKKSCLDGEAKNVEKLLLRLCSELFPDLKPLNLMTIKTFFSEAFGKEVIGLYQYLYEEERRGERGGKMRQWSGSDLFEAFDQIRWKEERNKQEEKKKEMKDVLLRELYPDT